MLNKPMRGFVVALAGALSALAVRAVTAAFAAASNPHYDGSSRTGPWYPSNHNPGGNQP